MELLSSDEIRLIIKNNCNKSLIDFTRYTMPTFEESYHHVQIAEALEAVERGEIDRLLISMPPRHGKTELSSIRFPPWYLGKNPNKRIIAASYSADLAEDFGKKARNVVSSTEYKDIFDVELSKDTNAKKQWDLADSAGGYFGTGVGGAATGKGAHVLLIDDPIKNRQEANSETMRQSVWDWYTSTAYTRLEKGGAVIIIMTRWHTDDLIGRLLDEQKKDGEFRENWTYINLPAISEKNEALWSDKYNIDALKRIKRNIGSFDFESLYQGRPTPLGGGIVKTNWFKEYEELPPNFDIIIQSLDTAQKTKEINDYSVIATWGKYENKLYLIDLLRGKWEMPDLEKMAISQYQKHKPSKVLIEDKSSGTALIQNLRRNHSMPITAIQVSVDKVTRVQEIVSFIESGYIYLPKYAEFLSDFITEHSAFPNTKHDDQVDTTSMAIKELLGFNSNNLGILEYYKNLAQNKNKKTD